MPKNYVSQNAMSGISKKGESLAGDYTETFAAYIMRLMECEMRIYHDSEKAFALNYFNHRNWEYQPQFYYLSDGTRYRPDFIDKANNSIIEVISTRQAFSANKLKYARFVKEYPNAKFEIRGTDGNIIQRYMDVVNNIPVETEINQEAPDGIIPDDAPVKTYMERLHRKYKTHEAVGKALGISRRYVIYLTNGERIPSEHMRKLIKMVLK